MKKLLIIFLLFVLSLKGQAQVDSLDYYSKKIPIAVNELYEVIGKSYISNDTDYSNIRNMAISCQQNIDRYDTLNIRRFRKYAELNNQEWNAYKQLWNICLIDLDELNTNPLDSILQRNDLKLTLRDFTALTTYQALKFDALFRHHLPHALLAGSAFSSDQYGIGLVVPFPNVYWNKMCLTGGLDLTTVPRNFDKNAYVFVSLGVNYKAFYLLTGAALDFNRYVYRFSTYYSPPNSIAAIGVSYSRDLDLGISLALKLPHQLRFR